MRTASAAGVDIPFYYPVPIMHGSVMIDFSFHGFNFNDQLVEHIMYILSVSIIYGYHLSGLTFTDNKGF